LRIPDDGRIYPLPPGLGRFPILRVADYRERIPERWREDGGFFIPMYQREAMWISFHARHWKPNAVKVGVGRINAVSGEEWDEELSVKALDYVVCPPQPWLDGINAGEGYIRQFVAMPLGLGYTVEGQITGEERYGGMQIVVYEPRPGQFPDEPPPQDMGVLRNIAFSVAPAMREAEMGLAAGGRMRQKIYPDPHGLDVWDPEERGSALIRIVNSLAYHEITGKKAPPSPISARTYTEHGLPWFDLYDEAMQDVAAPETLKQVKSVSEMDAEKGAPSQEEAGLEVPEGQVKKYKIGEKGIEEDEA
jgi:hypothetical protein